MLDIVFAVFLIFFSTCKTLDLGYKIFFDRTSPNSANKTGEVIPKNLLFLTISKISPGFPPNIIPEINTFVSRTTLLTFFAVSIFLHNSIYILLTRNSSFLSRFSPEFKNIIPFQFVLQIDSHCLSNKLAPVSIFIRSHQIHSGHQTTRQSNIKRLCLDIQ